MNPHDEAKRHRSEPKRVTKQKGQSLSSSLRAEPIIPVWNILKSVGKKPAGIRKTRNEQRESEPEHYHEAQERIPAHPAVRLSMAIKMGGHANRQMRTGVIQVTEETQIKQSKNECGHVPRFHGVLGSTVAKQSHHRKIRFSIWTVPSELARCARIRDYKLALVLERFLDWKAKQMWL